MFDLSLEGRGRRSARRCVEMQSLAQPRPGIRTPEAAETMRAPHVRISRIMIPFPCSRNSHIARVHLAMDVRDLIVWDVGKLAFVVVVNS